MANQNIVFTPNCRAMSFTSIVLKEILIKCIQETIITSWAVQSAAAFCPAPKVRNISGVGLLIQAYTSSTI